MPLVLAPHPDGPAAPRAIDLGGIVPDRVAGLGLAVQQWRREHAAAPQAAAAEPEPEPAQSP